MNALASKPKAAAEPAPVLPEDIRRYLGEARIRHSALTAEQMRLAEQSLTPEGEKAYFAVVQKMTAVSADIERYDLALNSLTARVQKQLKDAEAAELEGLRGRTGELLIRRLEAAKAFETAAVEMVNSMRTLVETSRAAYQSWPGKEPGLTGLAVGHDELNSLIAAELYRLGVPPVASGGLNGAAEFSLPAPKAPTLMTAGSPSQITPLVDSISAANTFAESLLRS